jgi:hypothetical protein
VYIHAYNFEVSYPARKICMIHMYVV